ncbi:hypothetical protein [Anaerosoma tenue]|uniref:hypothetical protein n=1 Tax=Anaerosoma tenue TaxID=2933588 RepID=UPI002260AA28|nr:hypothetical protein [Anaerosoma tenue]MCK8115920.1 hypothetical protein [Anaerosoma tenue]
MTLATRDGLVSGLILGTLIAFIFALVIRLIPDEWLVNELYRALLYAAQVPAALLFVPIATGVARFKSESPRHVLLWACSGALAFDGLVLGFWPSLYGHDGVARAVVATLLLWAFAWIVAAGLLVAPDEARVATVRR